MCTAKRTCLFGEVVDDSVRLSDAGLACRRSWVAVPTHWTGVDLDAFIVMPNHLHGVVVLSRAGQAPPLPIVVGSFKSEVSRRIGRPIWQRSYYDRVIRDEDELRAIRQYIEDNPLKWAVDRDNPEVRRSS